jgi:Zn-dependent metalloprotease
MKKFNLCFILSLIVISVIASASQWNITHEYTAQSNTLYTDEPTEHDTIKLSDILSYTDRDGVMHFDTNKTKHLHGFTGDSIIHYYGYLFDVGEHNELRLRNPEMREYSRNYKTFQYNLYNKDIYAVFNAAYFIEIDGKLSKCWYKKHEINVDTNSILSKEKVLNSITDETSKYKVSPEYPISPELIIKKIDGEYKLVYEIGITSFIPLAMRSITVDAITSEIISNVSKIRQCNGGHAINSPCTTTNTNVNNSVLYYQNTPNLPAIDPTLSSTPQVAGTRNIPISYCSATNKYIYQYQPPNLKLKISQGGPPIIPSFWGYNNGSPDDCVANTAYWGTIESINFFEDMGFNFAQILEIRLLLENNGTQNVGFNPIALPVTHQDYEKRWDLKLGRGTSIYRPRVTLDIIGHELAHAVDEFGHVISEEYDYIEAAIIEEAFCDIFGIIIESKFRENDWTIGNDNPKETRSLEDPFLSNSTSVSSTGAVISGPQPKYYQGINWKNSANCSLIPNPLTGKSIYAHHNTGVVNHWFYLISEGAMNYTNENGDVYNFSGIGIEKASELAYLTFTDELGNGSYTNKNFQELRRATLAVIKRKFHDCSTEANAVRKAWDAVGVTGGCELAVKLTTSCNKSVCRANTQVCGYSGSATSLKFTWKEKISGVYQVIPGLNSSYATLVCGKEYQVRVDDVSNPAECVIIKNFTCQASTTGSINLPCPPSTIMTASYNVITNCNGNDITGSIAGGIPPYTYNWSNGSTTQNLTNVPSGTYGLTVSDDGCSNYQNTFSVDGFPPLNVSGQIQTLCSATDVGAITLNVSGGKTPYAYHWSNGANSQNLSTLSTGSYAVTVTDANGCSKNLSYYVGVSSVTLQNFSTTPSCFFSNDGVINLGVYGGTAPYTYQWQGNGNSQTVQNPTGLKTGQHCVTVTDANGCINSACYNVPAASYSYMNVPLDCERIYTCNGQTYTKDMLDYANIAYNFNDCVMTIPCSIQNGNSLSSGGSIQGWFLTNITEKCRFTCQLGNVTGTGKPANTTPTIIPSRIPCTTSTNISRFYNDYYCNSVWVKSKCIRASDPKISNNLNDILVHPNPFGKNVSIQFETDFSGSASIHLYNIIGQEVFIQPIEIGQGTNRFDLDFIDIIPDGVYLLTVNLSNGNRYTQKLIHQN